MWTRIFTEFRKLEHVIVFLYYLRVVPRQTVNRFLHLAGFMQYVTGADYRETQLLPTMEDNTLQLEDEVLHHKLLGYGASNDKKEKVAFVFMPQRDTCCGKALKAKRWHSTVLFRYGLPTVDAVQYVSECRQCSAKYYMSHYDTATGRHYHNTQGVKYISFTPHTVMETKLLRALDIDM